MKFSERKGYVEVSDALQTDNLRQETKNILWNVFFDSVNYKNQLLLNKELRNTYWTAFKKQPSDLQPSNLYGIFRDTILVGVWYDTFDLLEFLLNFFNDGELSTQINEVLEKELVGYRFVKGQIVEITDKQEIEMLENALADQNFPHVRAHLQRALELLSDRKNPDYRNSIKESISAVESIAKEISQKPKAELSEALKEIEKQGKLHGAMKKAFESLYGYTSDANGIRHALMEEDNLTVDDAKFFLLSCTSFINYLKAKM